MNSLDSERQEQFRAEKYSFRRSIERLGFALLVFGILTWLVVKGTYALDEAKSLELQCTVAGIFAFFMMLKIVQRFDAGFWAHRRGQQFTTELVAALSRWNNQDLGEAFDQFTTLCTKFKRPWSPETRFLGAYIARWHWLLRCGIFNYALRWHYLVVELAIVVVFARHPQIINACTLLIGVAVWVELWQVIAHRLTLGQYHDYFHMTVMLHVYPRVPPRREDVAPSRIDLLRRFLKLWAGLLVATLVGYAGIYAGLHEVNPSTFYGVAVAPNDPAGRMLHALTMAYFSTITMMTVGYGDIYPVTPIAQFAVLSEVIAAFGLAVLLLTLASLAIELPTSKSDKTRKKRIVGPSMAHKKPESELAQEPPLKSIDEPSAPVKNLTRAGRRAKRDAERQARIRKGMH